MLSEIIFKSPDYLNYKLSNSESGNELTNLNKINIFIGQNNSGKSRFLRTLFKDNDFEFFLLKQDFRRINGFIIKMRDDIKNRLNQIYITEVDQILTELNDIEKTLIPLTGPKLKRNLEVLEDLSKKYISIRKFGGWSHTSAAVTTRDPQHLVPLINNYGQLLHHLIIDIFPKDFIYNPQKIYIPILRGLRPIEMPAYKQGSTELDPYTKRTIVDYFPNVNGIDNKIFTGLNLYEEVKKKIIRKELRKK